MEPLQRAAATAWLAPFPPAAMENRPPIKVSPGLGIEGNWRTISVLELPTTITLALFMVAPWVFM